MRGQNTPRTVRHPSPCPGTKPTDPISVVKLAGHGPRNFLISNKQQLVGQGINAENKRGPVGFLMSVELPEIIPLVVM